MMLKLFVCIALVVTVSCKGFTNNNNNNKFMVVLKDESTMDDIYSVMSEIEMAENKVGEEMGMSFVNFLFPVVFAELSEGTVEKISALQEVAYIEKDQPVYMYPISEPSSNTSKWLGADELTDRYGLDVLDKPQYGCIDEHYDPPNDGGNVDIYILDTGINYNHIDFGYLDGSAGTRAKYGGYDAIDANGDGADCQGHGSHCAGISGGLLSGVAKKANLLSIRVLGCTGSGSTSGIVKALNFVGQKHNENKGKDDFVASLASMSLGGGPSSTLDKAVNALVAEGVTVVTASGNDGADACNSSPGSAGDNINVGAHSEPVESNGKCMKPIAYFSNWGKCVDVIAPGMYIESVAYPGTTGFTKMSGTSMACPHVAGAAALILKNDKTLTPKQVKEKIIGLSVDDVDRSADPEAIRDVSKSKRLHVPTSL